MLWTRTARRDLEAIVAYIAEDSIENALSVLDRLHEWAESLTTAAERGRLVPELRSIGVHQYRELVERPCGSFSASSPTVSWCSPYLTGAGNSHPCCWTVW